MKKRLKLYRSLLGSEAIDALIETASQLHGKKIIHINSIREGGGVAEILTSMIPLMRELDLEVDWKIFQGNKDVFQCTKMFHNLLQGQQGDPPDRSLLDAYEKAGFENASILKEDLNNADFVFIHDPQPLSLIPHFPLRKGTWIWRCHIDLSSPSKAVWNYLRQFVEQHDGTIFSLQEFARDLPHPIYIIPPSIDPFNKKNVEISHEAIKEAYQQFGIEVDRPTLLQVSRFDRLKDPLGVIEAYQLSKEKNKELQLIMAGCDCIDDPEGAIVFKEAQSLKGNDPDIHLLLLSPSSHKLINAFQRGTDIILQKSIKEGFGLTVSEALWKSKPVIGGNTGGIRLQVIDNKTGFLVNSPKEAAERIDYLLAHPEMGKKLGESGRELVKEKFLITRHLNDYLKVMTAHLK